jgi:ABC-type glycerol-3-phosphate transport system substrate-binding protein
MRKRLLLILTVILALGSLRYEVGRAQTSITTLSVAVFPGLEPLVRPIVARYIQANIRVEVRTLEKLPLRPSTFPQTSGQDYFKEMEVAASTADIIMVSSESLGIEATRASYVLDLKSLISADNQLNTADYQPQAWKAFQWDYGFWALPFGYDPVSFLYDRAAFSNAGLNPPTPSWTMDDLTKAARALAVKAKSGGIETPGLYVPDAFLSPIFAALSGGHFYNDTTDPIAPHFTSSKLDALIQTWLALEKEGVVTRAASDPHSIPLQVGTSSFGMRADGSNTSNPRRVLAGAMLPGDKAGLTAIGFAVSSGTASPDQAYALAKFLIADQAITQVWPFSFAVKTSLQKPDSGDNTGHPLSKEGRAFVAEAINKAIPAADVVFGNYLSVALQGSAGLAGAQQQALEAMKTAAEKRRTIKLVIPGPAEDAPAGKIALKFGLYDGGLSLLHVKQWGDLEKQFTQDDPQVGKVIFDHIAPTTADWGQRVRAMPENDDCFYSAYARFDDFKPGDLIPLDPLLHADPTFKRENMIALESLTVENKVWGLPIGIIMSGLRYDKTQFDNAGVALPTEGWTIYQFADALKQLKTQYPDQAPFIGVLNQAHYLRMLVAAYGYLPIDPRTHPPTINFTDPKTVDAIRQVLNLAKDGYVYYQKSATFSYRIAPPKRTPAITSSGDRIAPNYSEGRLVSFPIGTDFVPLSYTATAVYISAKTAYPEACYRWLRTIAQHPELFDWLPADRSLVDNRHIAAQWSPELVTSYRQIYAQIRSPKAVLLQDNIDGDPVATLWLKRAFDRYILENADLESQLVQAEQFTKEFLACKQQSPAPLPPPGGFTADCALKVDPTIESVFKP